jgi:hypothetical protein
MGDKGYGDPFFCGFILFVGKPRLYAVENDGNNFSPLILQDNPYVVHCTTSTVDTGLSHSVC